MIGCNSQEAVSLAPQISISRSLSLKARSSHKYFYSNIKTFFYIGKYTQLQFSIALPILFLSVLPEAEATTCEV